MEGLYDTVYKNDMQFTTCSSEVRLTHGYNDNYEGSVDFYYS